MSSEPNSALYWLPLVRDIALTPATEIVPYDHVEAMGALEDGIEYAGWQPLLDAIWAATQRVGPPSFLRTDLASAKHDGPSSYRIDTIDDVNRAASFTVQDNELKFWPMGPYPSAFLVREFLELPAPFKAFDGHPIAREWRLFATADQVLCRHFYWPEDAILSADLAGWERALATLANDPPPAELDEIAMTAAFQCSAAKAWSVDFAQDVSGRWYLIDMATAESSWHPDHEEDS